MTKLEKEVGNVVQLHSRGNFVDRMMMKKVFENDNFLGIEELKEKKPDYKKKRCYRIA